MNIERRGIVAALSALAISTLGVAASAAQTAEVKEKPPMYTYVGNFTIPRARWADMDKQTAADEKVMDKAVADGTIIAYGNDVNLVHREDTDTHDSFWSATSMAGVLKVLEDLHGVTATSVLSSATKHSDNLFVSHFYNWRAGSWKAAFTHGASYKLKADAPDDAIETLSKSFIVPLLEKALQDGVVSQYEVDEEAIHTEAPGTFWVFYICPKADGLDKVNAALGAALKEQPLTGSAIGSMVDFAAHRDYLALTNATYK
jgi:hypothetical protein